MTLLVSGTVSKGISVRSLFLNNSLWPYWLRHRFFTKKSKLIWFCRIWRSFCRRKTYSGQLQISAVFLARINKHIQLFLFVINGFHDFRRNSVSKNQNHYFHFCLLLPSLINGRLPNTLSEFKKGTIEHNWRAKVWLYGFDSVFWQVLIELLFVVFLLLLLAA